MSRGAVLLLFTFLWMSGLASVFAQGGQTPTLISVQGAVTVRRHAAPPASPAAPVPAVRTMTLAAGDTLRTGSSGRATLLHPDGSETELNQNTTLRVPPTAPGRELPARLDLLAGEVFARISPGRRMIIETPAAVAGVRSTELNLAVAEDGTATLTVGEGEVGFTNPHGSVRVREGQQSVARPGQAPSAPVTVNVPFIIQWTNEVQPVALLLEPAFVSQDPAQLAAAQRQAEALPPGPEQSRRLGDVHHDRGELQEALVAYEAARERLGPEAPAAERAALSARIGQTLLELGKLPEAEAALRRSLALDPAGADARAGLVMTLLSQRQTAAAVAEARAGVERESPTAVALTALALAQIRSGEREAAMQSLARAVALDPTSAPAHAWRSFLLRAAERLEQAEEAARRAVTLAPFSSLARQSLSDALFALGQVREARKEAERAVELNPLSPGAHVSLGRALLQAEQIEPALRAANKAVALDPDLERARFFRGLVLAQQRRLGAAERELARAVELDPGYLEARAFLARVYLEQGRSGEAIAVAEGAIAREPAFAPARGALGRVYWRAGRLGEAGEQYRRALELSPGSALYLLELARVFLDQNNLPDALANGLAAVAAAPSSSEAHAVLGLVYDRMSNPEQALRQYREAVSFSPENALARFGVGFISINPSFGGGGADVVQAVLQSRSDDGLRELAQAALRDPSVLSLIFKPGVTTEIAPASGSNESRSLEFTHRDQFFRGKLHDLSFGSQQWRDSYRNGRQERSTLGVANLAAAPSHRIHLLAVLSYLGGENAVPGPTFDPDTDDREYHWLNTWSVSTRLQVDPDTFVWFHAAQPLLNLGLQNPDSPMDAGLPAFSRIRNRDLYLEGRLDHRWGQGAQRPTGGSTSGGQHTTSYALSIARRHLQSRIRLYEPLQGAFQDLNQFGRHRRTAQILQHDYRPGSYLSVTLGITHERFTERNRGELVGVVPLPRSDTAETSWLPFGQATYVLTRRDLIRAVFHERRQRGFFFILQPSEAFLVGELPSLALGRETTNYELDYEHRFSPRSFAKLFLFRSNVGQLQRSLPIAPPLWESLPLVGFTVPRARIEGLGVRYERQIGRFLSSYLRYIYSDMTDQTGRSTAGRQLPMSPHSRAVLGLNYVDRAGTKIFAEANWSSKMYIDPIWSDDEGFNSAAPRPEFPARLVISLRFGKEPTVRREWVFRVNNVFNSETIYWPGFPAPGRTYQLEYRLRF